MAQQTVASNVRSEVRCDGLFQRVKREVQLAAIAPAGADRDASLTFWHAKQRAMSRIYYGNGLAFDRYQLEEDARFERECARKGIGSWVGSFEQRSEVSQMGLYA